MKSVDKNDVDIYKLFNWGSRFDIKNSAGETTLSCYIRVVGDADINMARVFGLRKSSELRKKLRDENSAERIALLPDIDGMDKETLVEGIVAHRVKTFTPEVIQEILEAYPKEPDSTASIEEWEKYQEEVDGWSEKRRSEIEKRLTKRAEKERKSLMEKDEKDLKEMFLREYINYLCESEMYKRFEEYCVYLSTFVDENYRKRLFSSFEEFDNLPTAMKEKFINFYRTLNIDMDELKK